MRITARTYSQLWDLLRWCRANPGKLAAFVTHEGVYEIKFKVESEKRLPTPASSIALQSHSPHVRNSWVRDLFLLPPKKRE